MASSMLVWDQSDVPVDGIEDVLLWKSYADNDSFFSIPNYLELHAERLRAKYLAFIHDLGESHVKGKRIVDYLDMGEGFSFWWMTKISEKSPYKSSRIYDCLRLMALEEILLERKPSKLSLKSADRELAHAIRCLCESLYIAFSWQLAGGHKKANWSLRKLHRKLPHSVQGIIVLLWHIVSRWPLRAIKKQKWFSTEPAILICSYFIHLDGDALEQGRFYSRQWEQLPTLMQDKGFKINWLQMFLLSSVVPNVKTGVNGLALFNRDSENQGFHAFLDTYLSPMIVVRALKRWMWLNLVAWRVRHSSANFFPSGSVAWLWPILRDDWLSSIVGSTASINCLWFELFDAAMRDMPHQKSGLYLCENQGWEHAFLHAWRKHGHGKIIGFQHATAPFWHLYYFDDPRTINSTAKCAMPLPDKLAVNGPAAWVAFIRSGYAIDQLAEVEALRYLNLSAISARTHSNLATGSLPKSDQSESDKINVLVLGDYTPESNHILLRLLERAMKSLPSYYKFTFKPHPGSQFDLTNYPNMDIEQTSEALHRILDKFDMALSANGTSAAVDAFLAGLPVIIGLDGSSFNLSPLRGRPGVFFVGTTEEMVSALTNQAPSKGDFHRQDLFWLDDDLPRWHHLLATISSTEATIQ